MYNNDFNEVYNAKVCSIESETVGLELIQGVKSYETSHFEATHPTCKGGNGTYIDWKNSKIVTVLNLYVYDLNLKIYFNVRDVIKEISGKKRFSKQFLEKIKNNLPKKIKVKKVENGFMLYDPDVIINAILNAM